MELVVAGSVSDFDEDRKTSIKQVFADDAGVAIEFVALTVRAATTGRRLQSGGGGVILDIAIQVANTTAASTLTSSLSTSLSSASAASTFLAAVPGPAISVTAAVRGDDGAARRDGPTTALAASTHAAVTVAAAAVTATADAATAEAASTHAAAVAAACATAAGRPIAVIIIIIAAVLVVVALLIVIYLKVLKKGGRAKLGDSSLGQTSPSKKSPSPAKKGEMLAMVSSPLGGSPKQSPRPVVSPKGPLQPVRRIGWRRAKLPHRSVWPT